MTAATRTLRQHVASRTNLRPRVAPPTPEQAARIAALKATQPKLGVSGASTSPLLANGVKGEAQ